MANSTVARLTAVLQMNNTKFKKGISGSQKAMGGFSKSMANLGGTIAAAFSVRAITNFTRASFRALDTQLKAERSLLVALNGRVLAQQMLIDQAKDLQKRTLYGDEETIRAAALVGTMVKEEQTIKRLIPLIQDFATAKQMQLTAAADLVAKSIGSSTNALSRYGITITGAVGSSERLQTTVDALTKAFGGQAEAAAEADRMLTQVKNSWGDFQEAFAGWLSSGGGGFIRRGVVAGIEDLTKLFTPKTTAAMVEFGQFMETLKDKDPAQQTSILSARLKEQRAIFMELVEQRKAQQKIIDDPESRKVAIRFAKTEVEKINEKQDALLEVIRLYEAQLNTLGNINTEIDTTISKLPQLKEVAAHLLPEGFDKAFGPGGGVLKQLDWGKEPQMSTPSPVIGKTVEELKAMAGLQSLMDETIAGWVAGMDEAFGAETFEKVEKVKTGFDGFGEMIGMSLVSQFDSLGVAIGKFASGAEDSFKGLGDAIMQNLGNILIMMGAQSGNIGLVLAGAAIQLGGGILRGLGQNSSNMKSLTPANSTHQFTIRGNDLVTVMDRNMNRTARFT